MSFVLPPVPFYFLRHGVTDHNLRRLVMEQLDVPLNDQGRRQAELAARQVVGLGISRIVSSPLSRARETAEAVGVRLGLPVRIVADLRERAWGEMTGRTHRELMRAQATPNGAESLGIFAQRIEHTVLTLTQPEMVLIVAHSGVCRVLRRTLDIDDGEGPVPNAVPLLFAPRPGGGWSERAITTPCAAVGRR